MENASKSPAKIRIWNEPRLERAALAYSHGPLKTGIATGPEPPLSVAAMLKPDPQTFDGQAHWRAEITRRASAVMEARKLSAASVSKLIFQNSRRLGELLAGGVTRLRTPTIEGALARLDDLEKQNAASSAKEIADHGERTQQT